MTSVNFCASPKFRSCFDGLIIANSTVSLTAHGPYGPAGQNALRFARSYSLRSGGLILPYSLPSGVGHTDIAPYIEDCFKINMKFSDVPLSQKLHSFINSIFKKLWKACSMQSSAIIFILTQLLIFSNAFLSKLVLQFVINIATIRTEIGSPHLETRNS